MDNYSLGCNNLNKILLCKFFLLSIYLVGNDFDTHYFDYNSNYKSY